MESDLHLLFLNTQKEYLVSLLQELAAHHPALQQEMMEILTKLTATIPHSETTSQPQNNNADFNADALILQHPISQPVLLPLNHEACLQRVASYSSKIQHGEPPQAIFDDLVQLLQEAEIRVTQYDHQQALDIYSIVLDERLAIHHPILCTIFDRAIDEFMSNLDVLLSEISSTVTSHSSTPVSPLLPIEGRQHWLKRLFSLWLKYIDSHHSDDHLPELLLEVAWSDDMTFLRNLVQDQLQQPPTDEHSNIVDFSRQARTRYLEKFLKELPHL